MLRREDENEDEQRAQPGVGIEQPGFQAGSARAVEIVAGEDRKRRD